MVKKQKFLKNLLTSVSVASIVASIGGSSVAFGVDVGGGARNLSDIWIAGTPAGDWLVFNEPAGILTVDAGSPGQIFGINVANKPGNTIINNNIIIGSIIGDAVMDTTINDATLTLDGNGGLNPARDENPKNDYRALGNVVLNNAASTLVVQPADNPAGTAGNIVLHGNITTTVNNQGILTFEGAGTVKEAIGADGHALAVINIGAGNVTLAKDVFTEVLNFTDNGNRTVTIGSNFTGKVDFGGHNGGTLTFNSADKVTFASAIVNGEHGILNVQTNLTATHADIGKINVINIGTAAVGGDPSKPGILAINASAADVALLNNAVAGADAAINFLDKKSTLKLYIEGADDRTITFHKNLPGFDDAVGGGIVLLQGTGDNTLTVQSDDGTRTLGTDDRKLDELQVRGRVTIRGDATADKLNISDAKKLNVIKGAIFLDESATSASIKEIHIGADDGTGTGTANYILDTKYDDFNILEDSTIRFDHADAQLTLRNSSAVDGTIIFKGNLSGINVADGGGIVLLENTNANKTLTVQSDNGTRTLGEKDKKLKELQVRGNVVIAGDNTNLVLVNRDRLDVSNANKLSVISGAVFTDKSATSAQIAEIHIGAASVDVAGVAIFAGKANYILDAVYDNFGILAAKDGVNNSIIFDHAQAQLTLRNSSALSDRTIIFNNHLAGFSKDAGVGGRPPAIVNGGIVSLESTNGKTLFVEVAGGTKTLGTARAKLDKLQVRGQVTIRVTADPADVKRLFALNVRNANKLNVIKGAVFTDESTFSANIAEIHIGADDGIAPAFGGGTGAANYILDAKYNNVNILTLGKRIIFDHKDAQLTLRNSNDAEDRTIIFNNNLAGFSKAAGGGAAIDHGGIVSLESTNGRTLFVESNGEKTLGIAGAKLDELQVRGQVTIRVTLDPVDRKAFILNVSNANKLSVIKGALFTDETGISAGIANVHIGAADGPVAAGKATYIIDAKYNHGVHILAKVGGGNNKIAFDHTDAQLTLRNSSDVGNRTITFYDHLAGFHNGAGVDHGGIVLLQGTKNGSLIVASNAGTKTLGTADHKIGQLQVRGNVMIREDDAKELDVSNALRLDVIKGAVFTDENATSAKIATINIGVDDGIDPLLGGGVGPADYIIDAIKHQFTILVDADDKINFLHADANLILRNSADANKAITLANNLDPEANLVEPGTGKGIVQLQSVRAGKILTINAEGGVGAKSLGTNGNYLRQLIIDGNLPGISVVIQPTIYAKTITLNVANLTTQGNVNGNIEFFANTVVTAGGNIGSVDFRNTAGTITLADGMGIGAVTGGGNNGTLTFAGEGGAGAITGLASVNFNGPGVVNLGAASATNFNINHVNTDVITAGPLNGAVIFNAAGQLTAGAGVTGAVNFGGGGTLTFNGAATFGSTIANGGRVFIQGENSVLTLQSAGALKTLGIPLQKLNEIVVVGKVTIVSAVNKLDISNTKVLNIVNDGTVDGTIFTDESGTSAQIATINIGVDGGVGTGPATYVLDAKYNNNINILANAGDQINFLHADAQLTLRNSSAVYDKTITLAKSLIPANDNEGIVEFSSVELGKMLTIVGKTKTLGTKARRLNEVIFSGAGKFTIQPGLYTTDITLNVPEIELHDITSDIKFDRDTKFKASGTITGNVDFNNQNGTLTLADTQNITGDVTSNGGVNGALEFLGSGFVGGLITNLKMLKAGAGNVALAAGNHSITEIQGSGMQNLTFADGFNLTGDINLTGGLAVNLVFLGNGQVSGSIGQNSSVGNIQIQAGTVTFDDLINAQEVNISNGAIAEIVENMIVQNIKGQGTVKFNNEKAIVIDSEISIDNIEIAKDDVEVKKVLGSTVRFTNSQEAILTLKEESVIGSIITIGDNSHSLALNANLGIAGDVGADGNRLKEIKLLGDHTLSIASSNFYSDVSTATTNNGKVIFKLDNGVAYGKLGTDEFRLSEVTFDSDSTVKADVYSKKIVINADKTASFAGTDTRTISIPGIPRLLEEFTYSTEIVSEEINADASSKIKFDNATLVRAPINGGQVISADDVWFKEKVDSAGSIDFAPDKYVILENDIKFSSIEASQAKIIVLAEKETITGNLTAKDLTIDLGTGQLKYGGDAKLTGELKLYSLYDSSKSAGGNIEIQSNSKLDVSQLDKLHIIIAGRTDINKISDDTKYTLISSVDGNGVSALDLSKITLDSVEQNRFVSWTIDPSSLTLHAKNVSPDAEGTSSDAEGTSSDTEGTSSDTEGTSSDAEGTSSDAEGTSSDAEGTSSDTKDISLHPKNISKEVLEKDFANEDKQLVKQLLEATAADRSCDAAKFTNNLGDMEKDDAKQAVDRLLSSGGGSSVGESHENPIFEIIGTMVMDIANQFTSQITSRSVNMHTPGIPIGSGDDDKIMYGVWGSPFYSIANQKMRKEVSGYKLKSAGGIVGFDSLINDDLLIGVAYSRIDTKVSHEN